MPPKKKITKEAVEKKKKGKTLNPDEFNTSVTNQLKAYEVKGSPLDIPLKKLKLQQK